MSRRRLRRDRRDPRARVRHVARLVPGPRRSEPSGTVAAADVWQVEEAYVSKEGPYQGRLCRAFKVLSTQPPGCTFRLLGQDRSVVAEGREGELVEYLDLHEVLTVSILPPPGAS